MIQEMIGAPVIEEKMGCFLDNLKNKRKVKEIKGMYKNRYKDKNKVSNKGTL